MFNVIKLIIGLPLFFIGMSMNTTVFAIILVMISCLIISRIIALDSDMGNSPFLFLIGMLFFLPVFYLGVDIFMKIGFNENDSTIFKNILCFISGILSFLSISK